MKKTILLFSLLLFGFANKERKARTIHVIVALCDNENQGIVPVPNELRNGQVTKNNLYWGALYGVKTYFKNSKDWTLVKTFELL